MVAVTAVIDALKREAVLVPRGDSMAWHGVVWFGMVRYRIFWITYVRLRRFFLAENAGQGIFNP